MKTEKKCYFLKKKIKYFFQFEIEFLKFLLFKLIKLNKKLYVLINNNNYVDFNKKLI
jgi:hypothetical protein